MKREKDIFLSQCMIVKNEEANIARALSWGKGVVDEQVVVDTGSTDRTAEIAEAMGARVCHFAWIDDFSAAKNFAIEQAKGRWIALLDADEFFSAEDAKKLREYLIQLEGTPYGQLVTAWIHLDNQGKIMASGTQVRVFRNAPYLRYHRRIHELIFSTDAVRGKRVDATRELAIFHTGYGKKESGKKTAANRNLRLIEKELEEHPDSPDMLGYLGDEYYSRKKNQEAEEAYLRAISLMPKEIWEYDVRSTMTFTKLLEILLARECSLEEFESVYHEARERFPKEGDFDYLAGAFFMNRKEWGRARKHLEQALSTLEQNGNIARSMLLFGQLDRAYKMLALCCYRMKDRKGCVSYACALLGQDRYQADALHLLLRVFYEEGKEEGKEKETAVQVQEFLGKLYDSSLKDRLFMLAGAKKAGYGALASSLMASFSKEELALFNRPQEEKKETKKEES